MKSYLGLFSLFFLLVACIHHNKDAKTPEMVVKTTGRFTPIKLYLTSNAIAVLDELIPLLPFAPSGRSIGYITTAGYNAPWVFENIKKIEESGFAVKPIDLSKLSENDLDEAFKDCDIIWVGGGNTFYLLQEVRRSGFDKFLIEKIHHGVPYVGTSAGSILMGPNIELVKFADNPLEAPNLKSYQGLHVFPLVPLAHYDHPDYKAVYKDILNFALEQNIPVVSLKENQFIMVEGAQWEIINSDFP
ncbi:Type 1 glutamine amidotransferase-like domain-containing protein [Aestuariivivens sediminis]|uniref:Type 1 glutamine amidotransferase-like domain-containing protein n=1 Tax=Aestuariivivens sediminis TaxID=2913557 RepID=UPI001F58DC8F|nr:Type 1 glutamine amidotransferase-like domain-containing protein [Aestuariivivens sediminis]